MAHTPGPWHVDTTVSLGAYGVWTDYPTHPGHDGAGYGSQICSMLPVERSDREQRDADARLIAAAPELLTALVETLDALYNETHGETDSPWIATVKEKARAAIAKAKTP